MIHCRHFQTCGGCVVSQPYETQIQNKLIQTTQEFRAILERDNISIEPFASSQTGFRARAEFRFYRDSKNNLSYAMSKMGSNHRTPIIDCPILLKPLQDLMPLLLEALSTHSILNSKLYACNFLSTSKTGGNTQSETIISLIYHKPLDHLWEELSLKIQAKLSSELQSKIYIVGRSKNQKLILSSHTICENLRVFANTANERNFQYFKQEGAFSQPNPLINTKMIEFILSTLNSIYPKPQSDALELYCGSGNFTLPLASIFRHILATEVVKSAIALLHQNMKQNALSNITPVRLNAHESIQALGRQRAFFRLKNVNLDDFKFDCVLVDPPRSGINDEFVLHFLQEFSTIVYISCNPLTLLSDMRILSQSHSIIRFGLFDQFPHTHHRECVLILRTRTNKT